MKFTVIDKENWDRKDYFEHYFSGVPCTYSMSVKLDITEIKNRKKKLYPRSYMDMQMSSLWKRM